MIAILKENGIVIYAILVQLEEIAFGVICYSKSIYHGKESISTLL